MFRPTCSRRVLTVPALTVPALTVPALTGPALTVRVLVCLAACNAAAVIPMSAAADKAAGNRFRLANDKLELTAPAGWAARKPKFEGIIDYEFAVPAAEGDQRPSRAIVGGAGGGIEANRRRWLLQFTQPDGSRTEDKVQNKLKKVAGCAIHLLDVSGTFQAPPFDPGGGGPRENYRLLVAVIDAGELGSYYVKFYGPARTVAANEPGFMSMIDGLRRTD